MITAIKQRKKLIIIYAIIIIFGYVTGHTIYKKQNEEFKTQIIEKIDIKENLSYKTNNIQKRTKEIFTILILSILIIPSIINISNIFYNSLIIGFLSSILGSINIKLLLVYISLYKLIPFIFLLILTHIGFKISKQIINYLLNKNTSNKTKLMKIFKKYLTISFILITYEFILFLYSEIINKYLITLLNIMWYN